jgi:excisionase family DNA binding protein
VSDLARALLDECADDPAVFDRLADALAERVAALVAKQASARPALLTVNDVAKALGCHPKTVRRRIHAGVLTAVREQDRVVIRADDLDRYIARLERNGARPSKRRATRRGDFAFLTE